MKLVLLIPVAVLLFAAVGDMTLRAAGRRPHEREMALAAAPCLIAGIAAVVPAAMRRSAGQVSVVSAAFVGMIVHLALSLVLAVAVYFVFSLHARAATAYALWLMCFFWASLGAVSAALIYLVRCTPMVLPPRPPEGPVKSATPGPSALD